MEPGGFQCSLELQYGEGGSEARLSGDLSPAITMLQLLCKRVAMSSTVLAPTPALNHASQGSPEILDGLRKLEETVGSGTTPQSESKEVTSPSSTRSSERNAVEPSESSSRQLQSSDNDVAWLESLRANSFEVSVCGRWTEISELMQNMRKSSI